MSNSRSESSRINGAQSTGPVSQEGRAISSQNALKLGIYSKRRFISDEKPEDYQALYEALASAFNPATAVEHLLLDRMTMAQWQLARLERAEAATIELARNRFVYASNQEKWKRYGGHEFALQLPQFSKEALEAHVPERDAVVTSSMAAPEELEKFVKVKAALQRQFDSALRLLREEQARRIGGLELERSSGPQKAASIARPNQPPVSEGEIE